MQLEISEPAFPTLCSMEYFVLEKKKERERFSGCVRLQNAK